jgi:Na+-exporting ATPase
MEWKSTGNPTEVALAVFVGKLGLERPSLVVDRQDEAAGTVTDAEKPEVHFHEKQTKGSQRYTLRTEFLFSSDVKRMTMIYADKEDEAQAICVTKGAVSTVHVMHSVH